LVAETGRNREVLAIDFDKLRLAGLQIQQADVAVLAAHTAQARPD
jgi:hypothetical protein